MRQRTGSRETGETRVLLQRNEAREKLTENGIPMGINFKWGGGVREVDDTQKFMTHNIF